MISNEIIQQVLKTYTRSGKQSAKKVKEFIAKNEPEFLKYLESSTYDDIRVLVEKHGILPNKEIIDGLSSAIVGGKIEGYLIHSIAQDKFWTHKYGIDIDNSLLAEDRFKLFLEGKLDASQYNYVLSKEENSDKNNFKKIALDNFKKNQEKMSIENELNKNNIVTPKPSGEIPKKHIMKDLMD